MAADGERPGPVAELAPQFDSQRRIRTFILATAATAGFFALRATYFYARDDLYPGHIYPNLPELPTATGEHQIPGDIPGMVAGADNPGGGYGYDPSRYALYVPPEHNSAEPLPLFVCLHGVNDENAAYLKQGLATAIRKRVKAGGRFPMAAFFPRTIGGRWEPGTRGADDLLRVLDRLVVKYNLDPKRVYLTGWSSGGSGVWALAATYPERWAAVVPLCATPGINADRLRVVPVWAFVGGADPAVPAWYVEQFVTGLWADGADAKCTVYTKIPHHVWTEAYDEPELYEWLGRQRKL